jgi:hypothetical protein
MGTIVPKSEVLISVKPLRVLVCGVMGIATLHQAVHHSLGGVLLHLHHKQNKGTFVPTLSLQHVVKHVLHDYVQGSSYDTFSESYHVTLHALGCYYVPYLSQGLSYDSPLVSKP